MIRLNQSHHQIRIDTTIKILEKDGTEVTAPVIILIGLNKVKEKDQYNILKIASSLFNKEFKLDRRPKDTPEKPWYKFW
jgi:hypothetical protein